MNVGGSPKSDLLAKQGYPASDPPRAGLVCGLDVLAGDHPEQPDGISLGGGELGASGRFDQRESVVTRVLTSCSLATASSQAMSGFAPAS